MMMNVTNSSQNGTVIVREIRPRNWDVWDACLLTLFVTGLSGNMLTIAVFRRRRMRTNNEAIFLTAMSITDIMLLSIKFFANIQKQYHVPLYQMCVLLQHVLPQALAWISPWLIVLTTIERTYAVMQPLKVASVFTTRLCFSSIISVCVAFTLLSSSQFVCIEYSILQPYFCVIKGQVKGTCFNLLTRIFPWLKSAFMSWIPTTLATMLNSIIIAHLYKASKERKTLGSAKYRNTSVMKSNSFYTAHRFSIVPPDESSPKCQQRIKSKEKQITFTLCVISVTFVILTLPYSTFDLLRKLGVNSKLLKSRNAQRAVLLLLDLLHATNFLMYCLTGKRFRVELAQLLHLNANCFRNK